MRFGSRPWPWPRRPTRPTRASPWALLCAAPVRRRISGVNVENAAYPAGLCAERVALGAFVTAGERELRVVAVAAAGGRDAQPCGVCLQALSEFGDPDVVRRTGGELRVIASCATCSRRRSRCERAPRL